MNRYIKTIKRLFPLKSILGLVVSIGCVYVIIDDFDFQLFIRDVKEIKLHLFIFASIMLIISVVIRSFRWHLFFKEEESKKIKISQLFKNEMIGYFGNNILPFRLGDIVRVSEISKATNLSPPYLFGTIAAERIIDIGSLFVFSICFLLFFWNDPVFLDGLVMFKKHIDINDFSSLFILIGFIFAACLLIKSKNLFGLRKLFDFNSFISAFTNIKGCNKILTIMMLSLLIWGIYLFNIIIIAKSTTFINLSISQSMLLLVAVTLSIVVIPSGPGHIGLFELAVIGVLESSLFDYSTEQAISFSIILHAYSYITYSVIGGYFFIKSNASLGIIK